MRRRALVLVIVGVLSLATTACSEDTPTPGSGASEDPSESPTDEETGETDAGEELPVPGFEPADGETISLNGISITAPDGWTNPGDLQTRTQVSLTDGVTSLVTLQSAEAIDASDGNVDQWVQRVLSGSVFFGDRAQVLVPVEIDGVESYHIREVTPGQDEVQEVGATIDRRDRSVQFVLATTYSAKEREEIVKSMLNTLTYE